MARTSAAHRPKTGDPPGCLGRLTAVCGVLLLVGCVSPDVPKPASLPVQAALPQTLLEELQVDEAYLRSLNDKVRAGLLTEADKEKLWQVYAVRVASRVAAGRRVESGVRFRSFVAPSF